MHSSHSFVYLYVIKVFVIARKIVKWTKGHCNNDDFADIFLNFDETTLTLLKPAHFCYSEVDIPCNERAKVSMIGISMRPHVQLDWAYDRN